MIGRKSDPSGFTDAIIRKKTGILFHVDPGKDFSEPLEIEFRSNKHESETEWYNALTEARQMVEIILMNFCLYGCTIRYDGCKQRLLYEMAAAYDGQLRQDQSTSKAVKGSLYNENKWISLVEISSKDDDFLQRQKDMLAKEMKKVQCEHQVSGVEDTKFCDPYAIVRGSTWAEVDKGVAMLKKEIKRKY